MLDFLNSDLGLLLVGAALGALGLFTWQWWDWVSKQAYLRAQVMLDRRLNLVEAIDMELGAFLANANGVIAGFSKRLAREQLNDLVRRYNEEQARWFGSAPARGALLAFYFSPAVYKEFTEVLLPGTEELDVALSQATAESWKGALEQQKSVAGHLRSWNALAVSEIQPD